MTGTVSVPSTVSVGEEDGIVQVCATLSGAVNPINITLTTDNSSPGTFTNHNPTSNTS